MALLEHRRTSAPSRMLRRRDVQRFEVAYIAVVHLIMAGCLIVLPVPRIVGPFAAASLFGFIPPLVWAVWFLVAAVAAWRAARRATPGRFAVMWTAVLPVMCAWLAGFVFAAVSGGPVVGIIAWLGHLVWWSTLAARLHWGETGARWGGS